jgi:hypothetical protein
MTRDQFIEYIVAQQGVVKSKHEIGDKFAVEPCTCGELVCQGWVVLPNDDQAIALQRRRESERHPE